MLVAIALGKRLRGAGKVHTLLSLQGNIPVFIHITHGKYHDSNAMDKIEYQDDAIYVMDKTYVDYEALRAIYRRLHKSVA